jgi:hypothetical protein
LPLAIDFEVRARHSKSIECSITVVGAIGKGEKNSDVCIFIGFDIESFGGATDGIFDYLLGMVGVTCNRRVGFSFTE